MKLLVVLVLAGLLAVVGPKSAQVMVSGAVARPTANTKRGITVSRYTAFQLSGCCHQHL